MAELLRSIRIIGHADWLLNGPRRNDVGPIQYDFHSGPVSFGGKIFKRISMKVKEMKFLR